MAAICYYGNVMSTTRWRLCVFYIFNSTVIDWTCYMFFIYLSNIDQYFSANNAIMRLLKQYKGKDGISLTSQNFTNLYIHSFTHSIDMCRIRQFLAVLRSFFHSALLCTFSCHPSPPTILLSSLTSSCHLFLGLPLNLVVPKFINNTFLGILFSSIVCTGPKNYLTLLFLA